MFSIKSLNYIAVKYIVNQHLLNIRLIIETDSGLWVINKRQYCHHHYVYKELKCNICYISGGWRSRVWVHHLTDRHWVLYSRECNRERTFLGSSWKWKHYACCPSETRGGHSAVYYTEKGYGFYIILYLLYVRENTWSKTLFILHFTPRRLSLSYIKQLS